MLSYSILNSFGVWIALPFALSDYLPIWDTQLAKVLGVAASKSWAL